MRCSGRSRRRSVDETASPGTDAFGSAPHGVDDGRSNANLRHTNWRHDGSSLGQPMTLNRAALIVLAVVIAGHCAAPPAVAHGIGPTEMAVDRLVANLTE